jgi:DNA-binding transcriptional ArsR family regulator
VTTKRLIKVGTIGGVTEPSAVPHPLPEPLVDLLAQRFRVLGEPTRIKLLDHLREGEESVGELQAALGASQQNLSKHLGILHAAGMVSRTKQGNRTLYAISDPSVFELCEQVCGSLRRQLAELDAILPAPVGRGR